MANQVRLGLSSPSASPLEVRNAGLTSDPLSMIFSGDFSPLRGAMMNGHALMNRGTGVTGAAPAQTTVLLNQIRPRAPIFYSVIFGPQVTGVATAALGPYRAPRQLSATSGDIVQALTDRLIGYQYSGDIQNSGIIWYYSILWNLVP